MGRPVTPIARRILEVLSKRSKVNPARIGDLDTVQEEYYDSNQHGQWRVDFCWVMGLVGMRPADNCMAKNRWTNELLEKSDLYQHFLCLMDALSTEM